MIDKGGVTHAAFLGNIGFQRIEIAKLALSWRMIHQADDTDAVLGSKGGQFIQQRFRTDLGAQVQVVAGFENSRRPRSLHRVG